VPAAGLYTLSCRANSMNKGNVPGRAPRIKISTLRVQSRYRMSSLGTGGALCFAKVCSMSPADIRMLAFWNFIGKRDHPLQTEKENGTESWDSNPVYDHRPRRAWHMIPVPNLNIVRCMCRHVAHAPPPHPTPDLEKQKIPAWPTESHTRTKTHPYIYVSRIFTTRLPPHKFVRSSTCIALTCGVRQHPGGRAHTTALREFVPRRERI